MKLSDHFTLAEMTVSNAALRKGLSNVPTGQALATLTATAKRMEGVRDLLGHPITILSGYRAPAVNAAVGGSKNSAHMTGHAVDFTCPDFGTPSQVASHLAKHLTDFDQIIEEFGGWVHVGFGPGKRGQELTARKVNGKTVYKSGIA
jgi:zinc D-Ala-D-Ala carboxypeptidase